MSAKPKACPFCGSDQVFRWASTMVKNECYVRCSICDASTGFYDDDKKAIAAWNKRTTRRAKKENRDDR